MTQTRRDNGSGTVRLRKDGRWEGRYTYGRSLKGRPLVKYFYGSTEREVKAMMRKFQKEIPNLPQIEPTTMSVGEYMKFYLYVVKFGTIKQSSFDRLEKTNDNYVNPFLGEMPLNKLEADDIQELLNRMIVKYSVSTIKKVYELLNQALKYAAGRKYVPADLMQLVRVPVARDEGVKPIKSVEVLTDEEVKCLLSIAEDDAAPDGENAKKNKNLWKLIQLYIFMLNTGIRCGEMLALTFDDINLDDGYVRINKNLSKVTERDKEHPEQKTGKVITIVTSPKSKCGIRTIPLNETAKLAVRRIIQYNKKNGVRTNNVATTFDGDVLNETYFSKRLHAILNRFCPGYFATSSHKSIHSLRHTFASMCIRRDIDIKVLSELLGHSSTSFTYNRYVHIIQEQKAKAIKMLDIYSDL